MLEQIGLSKEINDAILNHSGPMGNILDIAEKIEFGTLDIKEVYQQVKLNDHQVEASSWVGEILKTTK
ncbi:hypothetical protein [Aliikangiella maris]|uniref:Uncharacterized protein n=2 Tax=Aliikangiella maris TaxID=3162458 RepID=A0ABV3MJT1_9GAMM